MSQSSAEYMRTWRAANRERLIAYRREHYQANIETERAKAREKARRRRAANPDHIRGVAQAWKTANPERVRGYGRKKALERYGLTPEDYALLLERAGGRCEICGTQDPGAKQSFGVDHDHETGRVRGLLCTTCNAGLGMFGDDLERIRKAVRYLEGE